MPNTMDREAVSVALLYQTSQLEGHLKEALKELGAAVVYEALTAQMDRDALEGSGAHVVIVNLDPEIESHLDEVYDLLDDDRYNVVFNDAQVSSGLSGWEQARWSRHLAAKIMGRPEVADPPRPPGAVAPPSPVQKIARGIPDVPQQAPPSNTFAPDAAATAMFSGEAGLDDALDALFKQATPPPAAPAARAPAAAPAPPAPLAAAPPPAAPDFGFDFDALLAPAAPSAPAPSRSNDVTLELPVPPQAAASAAVPDFDFDASLSPSAAAAAADDFALDLDFAAAPAPKAASDDFDLGLDLDAIPTNPVAASSTGGELDFDFDLGSLDLPEPAVASATREQARDIASDFGFSDSDFGADPFGGLDAALEPGSRPAPAGADAAGEDFSFGAELDALFDPPPEDTRPRAELVDFDSAFGGAASPSSAQAEDFAASIPAARDADPAPRSEDKPARSFDLSRFSLEAMSDEEVSPPPAANIPKVEKVSTESFLSGGNWSLEELTESDGDSPAPAPPVAAVEKVAAQDYLAPEGGDASKFDFGGGLNLDLIPMEEAVSPDQDRSDFFVEHRLDSSNAAKAIRRVIVLGASIGGPEAVREYLSGLPARFPALFVLAQHMGAEFLELMAAQLAKATPLTVRAPGHGERVSQGEVVVVPTTHRLLIDADGVVQLAHLPEASPYTPSIDLIVRDMADTFGSQATLIIFSGMAHDAIEGAKHLTSKSGQVWAQDPDTCVISSMVDGARDAGVVVFTGSPSELSKHTIASIGKA